ncbi:hypothetical protein [Ferroplasma sp.]|uniref:hypothetical protein n=1 Tax=Ferroplasma sp. TaxID=2591003 RepID=UPI00307FB8BF
MSEDNNGNRNSIKPIRNKMAIKNVKDQLPENKKEKIKGEREDTISETHSSIDPFGIKKQKKIVKETNNKNESKNYFRR